VAVYWGDLTKGKIKRVKDSVTLGNGEGGQAIRQTENPEKRKEVSAGFCVKQAVIKSWRVSFGQIFQKSTDLSYDYEQAFSESK
jgi:hypothetical protein